MKKISSAFAAGRARAKRDVEAAKGDEIAR
jgi:hypothetical protein